MSKTDFRTKSTDELTFYVYDNLRSQQAGMSSNIYYYDTLQEAIQKYNELPKEWTTAIGGSIHGMRELDLIQRRMGESVLVTDFKKIDFWKDDKAVQGAIDELIAYLNVQYEANHDLLGNRSIIMELERYKENTMDPYFNDKLLNPSNPKYLISSIEEAHVLGHGWMPFLEVLKMCDDYGYANPECPNITRLNVNYCTENGRMGQADISTHDFGILKEKTELFLQKQMEKTKASLGEQIKGAEDEKRPMKGAVNKEKKQLR